MLPFRPGHCHYRAVKKNRKQTPGSHGRVRMSKFTTIFTVMIAGVFAPAFYASSLQDWEFNINGTTYYPSKGSTFASFPV